MRRVWTESSAEVFRLPRRPGSLPRAFKNAVQLAEVWEPRWRTVDGRGERRSQMRRIVMLVVIGLGLGVPTGAYPGPWSGTTEHRGCCSHHSGVCGCSKGHATCCDG